MGLLCPRRLVYHGYGRIMGELWRQWARGVSQGPSLLVSTFYKYNPQARDAASGENSIPSYLCATEGCINMCGRCGFELA